MIRTILKSCPAVILCAFLVGFAFHSIPGATDPRDLWVGNLSWPYILIPAVACVGARSLGNASLRAAGAGVAMVLGFYNVFVVFTATAQNAGLSPDTPTATLIEFNIRRYVELNVLGGGGIPWVPLGAVAGIGIALLYWWTKTTSHTTAFWVLVAALGAAEPVLHFAPFLAWVPFGGYALDMHGIVIALAELSCAAAVLALSMAARAHWNRPTPAGTR